MISGEVADGAGHDDSLVTDEIGGRSMSMQKGIGETASSINEAADVMRGLNEIATAIAAVVEEQAAATQEISRNEQEASNGTQEVLPSFSSITEAAQHTGGAACQRLGVPQELVAKRSDVMRGQIDRLLAGIQTA